MKAATPPNLYFPPFASLLANAERVDPSWPKCFKELETQHPQHGPESPFLFLLARHGGNPDVYAALLGQRVKNTPHLHAHHGQDLKDTIRERLAFGRMPRPWTTATTALHLAVAYDLITTVLEFGLDYAHRPKSPLDMARLADALFPNRPPNPAEAAEHARFTKTPAAPNPFVAPLDAYLARHGLDDASYAKNLHALTKVHEEIWLDRIKNLRSGRLTPYVPKRDAHRPLAYALAADLGVGAKVLFPMKFETQPQDYAAYWNTLASTLASLKPEGAPAAAAKPAAKPKSDAAGVEASVTAAQADALPPKDKTALSEPAAAPELPVKAAVPVKQKPVNHAREQLSEGDLALLGQAMQQWGYTPNTLPNSKRLPPSIWLNIRTGPFKTLARGEVLERGRSATEPSLELEAIRLLLGDYRSHLNEQQRIANDLGGEAPRPAEKSSGVGSEQKPSPGTLLGVRAEPPKRPPPPPAESSRKTGRRKPAPGGG